ncbi:MAG: hypothetical protein JNM22_07655 [Saprospiraceae bacterium]|nr:hypothetical protein [Saprospiraceae bacterium]
MKKRTVKVTVLNTQVVQSVKAIPVRVSVQRDNMIRVLHILYRLAYKSKSLLGTYVEVSSTYWQKCLGKHYERPLKLLKGADIVQSTESYSNYDDRQFCKAYRINPNLIDDQVEAITYTYDADEGMIKDNSLVAIHTRRMLNSLRTDFVGLTERIKLYIDQREFLDGILIDDEIPHRNGVEIDYRRVPVNDKAPSHLSVRKAKEIAKKWGLSLIKDKNRYLMDYPILYFRHKRYHVKQAYVNSIAQFQYKTFYAKRNGKNFRLDSNITSLPKIFLPYFFLKGNPLIQIDLSNSQFNILASLIEQGRFKDFLYAEKKNTFISMPEREHSYYRSDPSVSESLNDQRKYFISQPDNKYWGDPSVSGSPNDLRNLFISSNTVYQEFNRSMIIKLYKHMMHEVAALMSSTSTATPYFSIDENSAVAYHFMKFPFDLQVFLTLAKSGKIYEFIKRKLGLQNVGAAKILAFEIFFASYRHNGEAKLQMMTIFPTLVKIIDAYKKAYGSNEFALLLQRRESNIFIDQIMPRLIEKGYSVLSKHDSILCIEPELKEVEAEMRSVLDKELGAYKLKITKADDTPMYTIPENNPVIRPDAHEDSKGTSVENSLQGKTILPNQVRKRQK